jgi:signal transduction histidine kinase/ActR/RegA family two-component response regulator
VPGAEDPELDNRVLVLTPTSKDAAITHALMGAAGIAARICLSFSALLDELERGAAAIMIPEEAVSASSSVRLQRLLSKQPPWSDVPVLVLASAGADSAASGDAVRTLGNVTLLERPMRVTTFVSAVRTALRARERQYQIRAHLAERARSEEALRLADQRKDEFLATLGHELRNPLAPLLAGLEVVKAVDKTDSRFGRMVTVMERQANHLARLVDDLLEVSRITRGLIDIQREPLDLRAIVHAAVDTSRPSFETARHELSIDLPAEGLMVVGDAVRLTQVFWNLLTNAAKYTDAGGRVWVRGKREGGRALVSVRDSGIGIPRGQLNAVFDMFMQVDHSDRRAQGGLGIGLTLVRSIVALHGGRVAARSGGDRQGSEFVVELPIVEKWVAPAEPSEEASAFPPCRILVVDDNRDAAESLGMLLTLRGATVSTANGGVEALAALDRFSPDTVLLDLGMPDMSGYEVARSIRGTPEHADVLLIALSGWGQQQDLERSREAGFDHHLVKPPEIKELRRLVSARRSAPASDPS